MGTSVNGYNHNMSRFHSKEKYHDMINGQYGINSCSAAEKGLFPSPRFYLTLSTSDRYIRPTFNNPYF